MFLYHAVHLGLALLSDDWNRAPSDTSRDRLKNVFFESEKAMETTTTTTMTTAARATTSTMTTATATTMVVHDYVAATMAKTTNTTATDTTTTITTTAATARRTRSIIKRRVVRSLDKIINWRIPVSLEQEKDILALGETCRLLLLQYSAKI